MELWSGWLAKVKLDIYATLRFTWVKERKCKKLLSVLQSPWFVAPYLPRQLLKQCGPSKILLKNKTRVCGIIRENRGLPNQLKEKSKNLQGEK